MKKLKVFLAVAVMALIVSGIFYACKKDGVYDQVPNTGLKMKKSSYNYYTDDVLGGTAPIGDWASFRAIGHDFINQGTQIYLALSMDYDRGYLRYGYITEEINNDVYYYLENRFERIFNGECVEFISEFEAREFHEFEDALDWAQTSLQNNRNVTMFQLGNDSFFVVLEQKPHFVLMTDEERTYLIANGESMPIDDFKLHAVEIITSKVGQFLVTTVENDNVYFMGISATGNQALWYNRLHEHFINHPPVMVDPDEPRLDGCSAWTYIFDEEGIEIYNEIHKLLAKMGLDIVYDIYTDEEDKKWIKICNGTCVC